MNETLSKVYKDYLNAAASGCTSIEEHKTKLKEERAKLMCQSGYHVVKRSGKPGPETYTIKCTHCGKWVAAFNAQERQRVVYE
jgi:hypothetical protein